MLFNTQYSSNLYILYLLYFKLNLLEFILINLILFIGIISVIYLIFAYKLIIFCYSNCNIRLNINYIFKQQNCNKQKYTKNNIFKVFKNVTKTNICTNWR